eukprot:CCRYP_020339-RA/>CCRYP_020339-RA protein AED:0.03 eAED:0.03 QI:1350/0/1/1/0/0/2/856/69
MKTLSVRDIHCVGTHLLRSKRTERLYINLILRLIHRAIFVSIATKKLPIAAHTSPSIGKLRCQNTCDMT